MQQCAVSMQQALTLHARASPVGGCARTLPLELPSWVFLRRLPRRRRQQDRRRLLLPSLPRTASAAPSGAGARCSSADWCITCAHRLCIMACLGDASGSLVKTVHYSSCYSTARQPCSHFPADGLREVLLCSGLGLKIFGAVCWAMHIRRDAGRASYCRHAKPARSMLNSPRTPSIAATSACRGPSDTQCLAAKTPLARDIMPAQGRMSRNRWHSAWRAKRASASES